MQNNSSTFSPHMEEKKAPSANGMMALIFNIMLLLLCTAAFVFSVMRMQVVLIVLTAIVGFVICPILFVGLRTLKPNEAFVLTLLGKYYGTLKGPGFYFVHPFAVAFNPAAGEATSAAFSATKLISVSSKDTKEQQSFTLPSKKVSLKTMTLNNDKQKINDQLGNPIIIGIVVIWRVANTAKAVFNVDNFTEYLSIQCDAALRNIVRLYPYDNVDENDNNEQSLRGSSQEIAERLREEIQNKVDIAGLEIAEARITSLAYAPEIAAVMLQRQQASAVIAARQMIVDGAVGMVDMALSKLSEKQIVNLDEERKAAMVSNLLVVLCGNKDPQPIVNSGSLY